MHALIDKLEQEGRLVGDVLAPLALRLYLAPVLLQAGFNKLAHFEDTAAWFGNAEWGLGLPLPHLLTALAAGTEFLGAMLLLVGLFTRFISIPLMFTMLVAAFTVHWQHGWLAIADPSSWLANTQVLESAERLNRITDLLKEHGNYDYLTASGNVVILNNGIEFAMTYFVMLLALLALGGGRFTSLDWLFEKRASQRQ